MTGYGLLVFGMMKLLGGLKMVMGWNNRVGMYRRDSKIEVKINVINKILVVIVVRILEEVVSVRLGIWMKKLFF